MKPLLQIALLTSLAGLQSCGDIIKHNDDAAQAAPPPVKVIVRMPVATSNRTIKDEKDLIGYWVGAFRDDKDAHKDDNLSMVSSVWDYSNKINVSIDTIDGNRVNGHSIDAGSFRPFEGTVVQIGNTYKFLLKEPGDNKYDGTFNFSINIGDTVVTGTWKANQALKTPVRFYDLTKQFFRYNPNSQIYYRFTDTSKQKNTTFQGEDGRTVTEHRYAMSTVDFNKYNASSSLLNAGDLLNLKAADLLVIRNAIYARHGYSFKNQALRSFFDLQDWYIPVSTDVNSSLTPIEKQNITLLLRYEKNAKEYYDTFGR